MAILRPRMRVPVPKIDPVDPTTVRLSDHFLLSDFMGSHSIYTKGLKNVFFDPSGELLLEGKYLCETLLEPILAHFGPISISYGYISPDVSVATVGYQDPTKPSYHRWDKGAAVDIQVHDWTDQGIAPIVIAHEIDKHFPYSRMITYSESPYICVATQRSEGNRPRRAFYENRYCGIPGAKPQFIRKSAKASVRAAENLTLPYGWVGAGYPTYHGGGKMQLQHNLVSKYTVITDFLYSTHAITNGIANAPKGTQLPILRMYDAGSVYDKLLEALDIPRMSIVRAYEVQPEDPDSIFSWENGFAIECIPPRYISVDDVAKAASTLDRVSAVSVSNKLLPGRESSIVITGYPIDEED